MKLSSILRNSIHFYELATSNFLMNKYAKEDSSLSELDEFIDNAYMEHPNLYEGLIALKVTYEYVLRENRGHASLNAYIDNFRQNLDDYFSTPDYGYADEDEATAIENLKKERDKFKLNELKNILDYIQSKNRILAGNDEDKISLVNDEDAKIIKKLVADSMSDEGPEGLEKSQIQESFEDSSGVGIDTKEYKESFQAGNRARKESYNENKRYFEELLRLNWPAGERKNIENGLKLNEKMNLLQQEADDAKKDIDRFFYEDTVKSFGKDAFENRSKYQQAMAEIIKKHKADPATKEKAERYKKLQTELGRVRFAIFDEKVKINRYKNQLLLESKVEELKSKERDIEVSKDPDVVNDAKIDKFIIKNEIEYLELLRNLNRGKEAELSIRKKFLDRIKDTEKDWITQEEYNEFRSNIEDARKLQKSTSTTSHLKRLEEKKSEDDFKRIYGILKQNITSTLDGDRKKVLDVWFDRLLQLVELCKISPTPTPTVIRRQKENKDVEVKTQSSVPKEVEYFKKYLLQIATEDDHIKNLKSESNALKAQALTDKSEELQARIITIENKIKIVNEHLTRSKELLRKKLKDALDDFKDEATKYADATNKHNNEFINIKSLRDLMKPIVENYIDKYKDLQLGDFLIMLEEMKKVNRLSDDILKGQILRSATRKYITELYDVSKGYQFTIEEKIKSHHSQNNEESFNDKKANKMNIRKKLLLKLSSMEVLNKKAFEDTKDKYKDISFEKVNIADISKESLEMADNYFDQIINEINIEMVDYINNLFNNIK